MMTATPVTVGVPVWNGERFLERALEAIRVQEFTDFVVLIRDNASTDGTEEIAREFTRRDSRFRYTRNPDNVGGARNANAILAEASSPFFVRLHADDEIDPRYLSRSVEKLEDAGPGTIVSYPRVQLIDEAGNVIGRHNDADLDIVADAPHERLKIVLARVVGQIQFGLMRTEAVREVGGISVSTSGEMIMPAALALKGKLVLSSAEEPLISIRQHEGRTGGNRTTEAVWIDPGRPYIPFPYSRSNALLFRAISNADLGRAESLRCYRTTLWNWTRPGLRSIGGDLARLPWDAGWVVRRASAASPAKERPDETSAE